VTNSTLRVLQVLATNAPCALAICSRQPINQPAQPWCQQHSLSQPPHFVICASTEHHQQQLDVHLLQAGMQQLSSLTL
jgi:hypothetical protein